MKALVSRITRIQGALVLCGIAALGAVSAHANPATDALGISSKFPGTYALIDKSGEGARECADKIQIVATDAAVRLFSAPDSVYAQESFAVSEKGCESGEGDIGPNRTRCTHFKKFEVHFTDTSPLTIAGFIREYRGIRLDAFDSDLLTWEHGSTIIPFGVLGLWNGDKFKCTYKRISE